MVTTDTLNNLGGSKGTMPNGKANLKWLMLYDFIYIAFLKKNYRNGESRVAWLAWWLQG